MVELLEDITHPDQFLPDLGLGNLDLEPHDAEKTSRLRKFLVLPDDLAGTLYSRFQAYQAAWNALVDQDRAGDPIRQAPGAARDYYRRRQRTTHPLRKKSFKRVVSIPVPKDLQKELKTRLPQTDWRKMTKVRLVRRGRRISLCYVEKVTLPISWAIGWNRWDLGLQFSNLGLTARIQSQADLRSYQFISKKLLTPDFINKIAERIARFGRMVAIDPVVDKHIDAQYKHLLRKLRRMQAEGATILCIPKRVSIREKWLTKAAAASMPLSMRRMAQELRPAMKPFQHTYAVMGPTGALILLEKEGDHYVRSLAPVFAAPRKRWERRPWIRLGGTMLRPRVSPLILADAVLHEGLAKLDMCHNITGLKVARTRQRVLNAFLRRQKIIIKKKEKAKSITRNRKTLAHTDSINPGHIAIIWGYLNGAHYNPASPNLGVLGRPITPLLPKVDIRATVRTKRLAKTSVPAKSGGHRLNCKAANPAKQVRPSQTSNMQVVQSVESQEYCGCLPGVVERAGLREASVNSLRGFMASHVSKSQEYCGCLPGVVERAGLREGEA